MVPEYFVHLIYVLSVFILAPVILPVTVVVPPTVTLLVTEAVPVICTVPPTVRLVNTLAVTGFKCLY